MKDYIKTTDKNTSFFTMGWDEWMSFYNKSKVVTITPEDKNCKAFAMNDSIRIGDQIGEWFYGEGCGGPCGCKTYKFFKVDSDYRVSAELCIIPHGVKSTLELMNFTPEDTVSFFETNLVTPII